MRFERVTAKGHETPRFTVRLEVVSETDVFLSGWEVDTEGTRTERFHLVEKTTVEKRVPLAVNLTYGTLEPVQQKA